MTIKPSSALRNEYPQISELAKASGEPIRDLIYKAELSRLSGEPTYTPEEVDARIEALFRACKE